MRSGGLCEGVYTVKKMRVQSFIEENSGEEEFMQDGDRHIKQVGGREGQR